MQVNDKLLSKVTFLDQLISESNEMIQYAFGRGLKVPGQITAKLAEILMRRAEWSASQVESNSEVPSNINCNKEIAYHKVQISELTQIHGELSEIVKPAMPKSIVTIKKASTGKFFSFGAIPLVRKLVFLELLSLALFILCASTKYTGTREGITFINASGLPVLINQIFYLAAAGLGASFYALFTVNKYMVEGTFDSSFESYYWVRFMLGLVSGTILANFITLDLSDIASPEMEKALLSILGGFSAEAVYRILNRLISSIMTLVQGDTKDIIRSREKKIEAKLMEQSGKERLKVASRLISLQQLISKGSNPEELKAELDNVMKQLKVEVS
ncbi:MAG: hypothetical protein JSU92_06375 [Deltaproteobacteria bacterium]|nr:MAG: hypothetical protein JSU92_06375 [Deltaproteobacteria bacterium]